MIWRKTRRVLGKRKPVGIGPGGGVRMEIEVNEKNTNTIEITKVYVRYNVFYDGKK